MNTFKENWIKKGITQEISKPGPAIHSQKWDDCVMEVKNDPSVNAYAVCTAQLGEESFKSSMTKSEVEMAKSELKKAIDIMEAGEVPHSLLARQDLEPTEETKKSRKLTMVDYEGYRIECYENVTGDTDYIAMSTHFYSLEDAKKAIDRFIRNNTHKGQVEQTGKALDRVAEKAEDVEDTTEKDGLIRNIKNIQLKRQHAIINARKGIFKNIWKEIYG